MFIIIIVIIVIIICCCIFSLSASGYLHYNNLKKAKEWRCVQIDKGGKLYVLGRFDKNEAECMYDPKSNGCYILSAKMKKDYTLAKMKKEEIDKEEIDKEEIDKDDLDEKCSNAIKEYPNVKTPSGVIAMDLYRCGKNGKQYELWNSTGYDNKNDQCYKILQNTKMNYIKYFDK